MNSFFFYECLAPGEKATLKTMEMQNKMKVLDPPQQSTSGPPPPSPTIISRIKMDTKIGVFYGNDFGNSGQNHAL